MASSDAEVVQRVQSEVGEALDRHGLLHVRRRMVVAVSGGADSLCLLDALVAAVPGARERLHVCHIDHQIRAGSVADADHVKRVAVGLGVSGTLDTVNVPALAKSERLGIEEAARIGRYRSLSRFADSLGTDIVLTGHTRDDSIETIVFHFLRGTGARGLRGIAEAERFSSALFGTALDGPSSIKLIRPLLHVSRADTVAYCEARGLPWLTDETNADPAFARNRVRGHLLPVLRTYNPSVDRALVRMAQVLGDEDSWLEALARERWAEIREDPAVDDVLSLAAWRRQPLPLQRRIVRLLASSLGHDEIGYEAVERALEVVREGGPLRAQLGGGVTVERRGDTLCFRRSQRKLDE